MPDVAYTPIIPYAKKLDTPATESIIKVRWNRSFEWLATDNPIYTEAFPLYKVYIETMFISTVAKSEYIIFEDSNTEVIKFYLLPNGFMNHLVFTTPLEFFQSILVYSSFKTGIDYGYVHLQGYILQL